jgi:hypothetical protein
MVNLSDICGDHQNAMSLKFHEGSGRNKAVDRHGRPSDFAENLIHSLYTGNRLNIDTGLPETFNIGSVRVVLKEMIVLPHNKTPNRMIDRRVRIVPLIYDELFEMVRQTGYDGITIVAGPVQPIIRSIGVISSYGLWIGGQVVSS